MLHKARVEESETVKENVHGHVDLEYCRNYPEKEIHSFNESSPDDVIYIISIMS